MLLPASSCILLVLFYTPQFPQGEIQHQVGWQRSLLHFNTASAASANMCLIRYHDPVFVLSLWLLSCGCWLLSSALMLHYYLSLCLCIGIDSDWAHIFLLSFQGHLMLLCCQCTVCLSFACWCFLLAQRKFCISGFMGKCVSYRRDFITFSPHTS